MFVMHHATFGNKAGSHQLISTTLPDATATLDQLRFMVDRPAGHIDSSVIWAPYWGCQPVNDHWAIWRGDEDHDAPRKNMVRVRVALLALGDCKYCNISEVLRALGDDADSEKESDEYFGTIIERAASSMVPIAIPGIHRVPKLLKAIWPRLWPAARAAFSVRTVFAPESINNSSQPMIVVFPEENAVRWRTYGVVNEPKQNSDFILRWLSKTLPIQVERVIQANIDRFPKNLTFLTQLQRICQKLESLHLDNGTLVDTLTLVRTIESLPDGFDLPVEDSLLVGSKLLRIADGSIADVRMASLTQLNVVSNVPDVEQALSDWVLNHLPQTGNQDAIWILHQHVSPNHATWWKRGVHQGLANAIKSQRHDWARSYWGWFVQDTDLLQLISSYFDSSDSTQEWLLADAPNLDDGKLLEDLCEFCKVRDWALLLAKVLGSSRSLIQNVITLRATVEHAEKGANFLVSNRTDNEIVDAATQTNWSPLISIAAETLARNSLLFEVNIGKPGHLPLLSAFLRAGRKFPQILLRSDFLFAIFDGLFAGKPLESEIANHLGASAAPFVMDHPNVNGLIGKLRGDVITGVIDEWFRRFTQNPGVGLPPESISDRVLATAPTNLQGGSIRLILQLLEFFPNLGEETFCRFLIDFGFQWDSGDHQIVASNLVDRQWKSAAQSFRWSWKKELKLVAYYAHELLSWSNGFLFPPEGVDDQSSIKHTVNEQNKMTMDVGIITMKEEEYSALLKNFGQTTRHSGAKRDYEVASFLTERGQCRIAITRCAQQGNAYAQTAASELISDLSPRFMLVVGIAGGVPSEDFCLGDVIVSDYIQDLTLEDTGTQHGEQRYNALGGPLHSEATRIVESLRAIEQRTTQQNSLSWYNTDSIGLERPSCNGRFTTEDVEWNKTIDSAITKHSERNRLLATARRIASSDRLVKDPELLQKWRQVLKSVAAVEMESAGVYLLCQRHELPFLAIRGISDIVGWKRDEAWTLYACHTAAAYVRMLVKAGVFCAR